MEFIVLPNNIAILDPCNAVHVPVKTIFSWPDANGDRQVTVHKGAKPCRSSNGDTLHSGYKGVQRSK